MKQLIYIIGSARSGTTLLDILLGNSKDIFSAGELNRFTRRNGFAPQRKPNDPAYEFWMNFRSQFPREYFDSDESLSTLDSIVDKCEHFESFWNYPFLATKIKIKYSKYLSDFYSLLFNLVNEQTIIESSKFPMRALRISKVLDSKIYYIYIRKDPAKVVKSLQKTELEQPSKGYFAANLYYFVSNAYCIIVLWILKKKGFKILKIKYEELVNKPEKVLNQVSEKFNLNLIELVKNIEAGIPMKPGLLFDGNRIRLEAQINLNSTTQETTLLKDRISRIINLPFYFNK